MLLILLDIFIQIRLRKRAVVHPTGQVNQQQRTLQKQMFILILASIVLFLLTTLPIGIYKIISPRGNVFSEALTRTSIYTGLIWFQSFNYVVSGCSLPPPHPFRMRFCTSRSISTFIV